MEGHLISSVSKSNEEQIDYKDLLYKINKMLNEIKNLGIDISKYEGMLKEIQDDIDKNGFKNIHVERFKSLEKILNIYAFYQEAIYNCRYVSLKINKDNTLEEIKYYANLVVIALMNIKKNEINNNKITDELISEIYEIAYNVLKMEIIITGKSDIYEYVKNNNIGLCYFDSLVEKDIMMVNSYNSSELQSMIYDIKRKGLNTNYFNIDFIKLLLIYIDKDYVDKIVLDINRICEKICSNNDILVLELQNIEKIEDTLELHLDKMDNNWKNVKKRMVSLLLVGSMLVGWGYLTVRVVKNKSSRHVFNMKVSEYIESIDTTYEFDKEVSFKDKTEADDYVSVTVYEPWEYSELHRNYIRYVNTYKLDDITFDSIDDLLTYNVSVLGKEISRIAYQYDENEASLYQREYRVIDEVQFIDLETKEIDEELLWLNAFIAFVLHVLIGTVGCFVFNSYREEKLSEKGEFFLYSIKYIIDNIKKAKKEKK